MDSRLMPPENISKQINFIMKKMNSPTELSFIHTARLLSWIFKKVSKIKYFQMMKMIIYLELNKKKKINKKIMEKEMKINVKAKIKWIN